MDASGNLYIADEGNYVIRRVDAATGVITIVAGDGTPGFSGDGGPATSASLRSPSGVAMDALGNLYIADTGNDRIRKVEGAAAVVPIPSLTQWGLIALAGLMAAVLLLRPRRTSNRGRRV